MRLGFIGCGNMGSAIIKGLLQSGTVDKKDITASAGTEKTRSFIKNELGIGLGNNIEVVNSSQIIFLAVKPQKLSAVIGEIRSYVNDEKIIVTLSPGKSIEWLSREFLGNVKIVRSMPNTPALVQESMSAVCCSENVTEEELNKVLQIFKAFGKVEVIEESLMDAVVAVSGSSPAFVFMFIEALADGAVAEGLPRDMAYKMAAQAVYGSSKLMLSGNKTPGELKDMVCSPSGTTIEGVNALEKGSFRGTVMEATRIVAEKSRRM